MIKWYEKSGQCADTVISSRIRFARNIERYPFPCRLSESLKKEIIGEIQHALDFEGFKGYNFRRIDLQEVPKFDEESLVECHLASPEFVRMNNPKVMFLSRDESVSIMVNEEDHIRLQVMREGLDLGEIFEIADNIDTQLDSLLKFAFNDQLGYLTQCPTNLGTGMRASVMLHLPALRECGVMKKISSNLIKLGLTVRGIYGEGTDPRGDIYQISNQVTLGISEKTALKNLNDITTQLINQEHVCRKDLSKNLQLFDSVCRSLGILKFAKLLSVDEFMKLISKVRLGLSMGKISGISYDEINAVTVKAQPYMLMKDEGQMLQASARDQKRATMVNEIFRDVEIK